VESDPRLGDTARVLGLGFYWVLLSISALKWPKSDIKIGYLPPPMIDTHTTYSMTEGFLSPNTHPPHKMLISVWPIIKNKKKYYFKIN
jgi:hypothetical protein